MTVRTISNAGVPFGKQQLCTTRRRFQVPQNQPRLFALALLGEVSRDCGAASRSQCDFVLYARQHCNAVAAARVLDDGRVSHRLRYKVHRPSISADIGNELTVRTESDAVRKRAATILLISDPSNRFTDVVHVMPTGDRKPFAQS